MEQITDPDIEQCDEQPGIKQMPADVVKWQTAEQVITDLQSVAPLAADDGNAWLLVHADFDVAIGRVSAQSIEVATDISQLLCPDFIQELRLFGPLGEWHVWRYGKGFRARWRSDGEQNPANCIEETQALWGTSAETNSPQMGWTTLSEERGACFAVPHANIYVDENSPLRMCVRHYLEADPITHLTTIIDSRLVALCDANEKPLPWAVQDEEVTNEN